MSNINKTDEKRYQELATKVATHMCRNHAGMAFDKLDTLVMLTISTYNALGYTDINNLRQQLINLGKEVVFDIYDELLADDEDFMEVLVEELGLAISDIDFEEALTPIRQKYLELVDVRLKEFYED
tara:strand:+ start:94 stop:471 length:378 start_codon:yes stop_codon:yes gene_type:complete